MTVGMNGDWWKQKQKGNDRSEYERRTEEIYATQTKILHQMQTLSEQWDHVRKQEKELNARRALSLKY